MNDINLSELFNEFTVMEMNDFLCFATTSLDLVDYYSVVSKSVGFNWANWIIELKQRQVNIIKKRNRKDIGDNGIRETSKTLVI